MCVNQKCIAVDDLRAQNKACPFNCNGNGVCNNKGNCHCNIGYSPPYCDHPGPGGSDDSGPASSPNSKLTFLTIQIIFLNIPILWVYRYTCLYKKMFNLFFIILIN